jgi:hypothetical protein
MKSHKKLFTRVLLQKNRQQTENDHRHLNSRAINSAAFRKNIH